jgi:hypothetical protein
MFASWALHLFWFQYHCQFEDYWIYFLLDYCFLLAKTSFTSWLNILKMHQVTFLLLFWFFSRIAVTYESTKQLEVFRNSFIWK